MAENQPNGCVSDPQQKELLNGKNNDDDPIDQPNLHRDDDSDVAKSHTPPTTVTPSDNMTSSSPTELRNAEASQPVDSHSDVANDIAANSANNDVALFRDPSAEVAAENAAEKPQVAVICKQEHAKLSGAPIELNVGAKSIQPTLNDYSLTPSVYEVTSPANTTTADRISNVSSSVDEEDDADTIELNRLRALNQQLESDLSSCKREHESALAKLRLQLASISKEKDDTVMKFAVKETQILDAQKSRDAADRKSRDAAAESEKSKKLATKMKEERDRACADAEKRTKDMQQTKREADQLRTDIKERDGRIKWLQDRLKYEMEQHQQCKSSLDSTTTMLADRVKQFDKLEAIFSHVSSALNLNGVARSTSASPVKSAMEQNAISSKSSETPAAGSTSPTESIRIAAAIEQHLQALTDKQANLEQRCADETRVSAEFEQHRRLLAEKSQEVEMLQAKLECIKAEMKTSHSSITSLDETLSMQRAELDTLRQVRIRKIELDAELYATQQQISRLRSELDDSKQELLDYKADTQRTLDRNRELMEYTEKLTARIVEQQAAETQHKTDAEHATNALQILTETHEVLQAEFAELQKRYDANVGSVEQRCATLQSQYDEMQRKSCSLHIELDEVKNDHRIAVRNHTAIVRDLKHQLAQFTRAESGLLKTVNNAKNFDTLSVHSAHDDTRTAAYNGNGGGVVRKTFSNNSLSQNPTGGRGSPVFEGRRGSLAENDDKQVRVPPSKKSSLPTSPEKSLLGTNEVVTGAHSQIPIEQADRQMLIERIVRLQRRLAKRNERIDAFNEQLRIAYEDLQKKTSIIERFAMNCDAEQLIINHASPRHAAEAKSLRQSVMESIFSVGGNNAGTVQPALTIEINKKLQAVLEDTLFKNITLKESLQTLGEEISKLSRDNEELRSSRLK